MCASPTGRRPGCRGRGQSPLGLRTPLGPSGQSSGCPAPGPPARSVTQLSQVWFPLCFSSNSLSKYGTSGETLESWVGMEAVTHLTTSQGSSVKINTPHLQASGRGWLLRDWGACPAGRWGPSLRGFLRGEVSVAGPSTSGQPHVGCGRVLSWGRGSLSVFSLQKQTMSGNGTHTVEFTPLGRPGGSSAENRNDLRASLPNFMNGRATRFTRGTGSL